MNLDNLKNNFKDTSEWAHYCKSLENTIIKLTKEVNTLKEKNEQLEEIIKKTVPIIETDEQKHIKNTLQNVGDEEAIAIMELAKLKEISLQRDLNTDECRKYDIYTKALLAIREKKNKPINNVPNMSDSEILSILEVDNGTVKKS